MDSFSESVAGRAFPVSWPGHWIGGQWIKPDDGMSKSSWNPNDGSVLLEVQCDRESISKSLSAAESALDYLAGASLDQKVETIEKFRRSLGDFQETALHALTIEVGKPRWEAAAEVENSIKYLDWIIAHADELQRVTLEPGRVSNRTSEFVLEPVGIAASYLPFSTPLTTFVNHFSAAILAGCPLIVMPSSHAMLLGMIFALIDQEIEMYPGAMSVVFGSFSYFRHFVEDRRVAAVLYTGSKEHCELIRRDSKGISGRTLILQSGGKNSVLVHRSADLDLAVHCTAFGAYRGAGELCSSTSRVFVDAEVVHEFSERLTEFTRALRVGRTDIVSAEEVFMGPLYSRKAVEKFLRFQTMANREAKKNYLWGKALDLEGKGYFVTPGIHLIGKYDAGSAYQSNVLFSPDVAIYEYTNIEQAVEAINTTDASYSLSIIADQQEARLLSRMVSVSNVMINLPTVELDSGLPLAGRGVSGRHKISGPGILFFLTQPKSVSWQSSEKGALKGWRQIVMGN